MLQARAKAAEPVTSPGEDAAAEDGEVGEDGMATTQNSTKPHLTGNPQIDYIHDPNLPRELNGYNLSSYPFFTKVPSDITFKCDGLHDGFYASVPHKCQLYHHCLFGTRYDFLCANYTAFDQRTFICHFVSEVDCENSSKYFKRNDALYKQAETTTVATTTTSTTTTTQAPTTQRDTFRERERDRDYRDRDYRDRMRDRDYRDRERDRDYRERDRVRNRDREPTRDYPDRYYQDRMRERDRDRTRDASFSNRKRKPLKRRRPVYEYYYDDAYADEEYEDEPAPPPVAKKSRKVLETVKPAPKSSERDYGTSKRKSKYDDEEPLDVLPPKRKSKYDEEEPLDIVPPKRKSKYDDEDDIVPPKRKPKYEDEEPVRASSRKVASSRSEEYEDEYYEDDVPEPSRAAQGGAKAPPPPQGAQVIPSSPLSVFSRPRIPPRINRPVPLNEKSKYEYVKNT